LPVAQVMCEHACQQHDQYVLQQPTTYAMFIIELSENKAQKR